MVAQTGAITASTDRGDLGARLEKTMQRLAEPGVRVLVVGEFKQGKSLLVNALINADVCPVDDDVATAVPTIVRHGEESATLVFAGNRPDDELPPPLERRAVPLEELEQYVAERGNPDNERQASSRRGLGAPADPRGRARPRRHARRRWHRLGARCQHDRRAAPGRRRPHGLRCRAGASEPEIDFQASGQAVSERGLRSDEDRHLSAVATHRRAGQGPPRIHRCHRPADARRIHVAPPGAGHQRSAAPQRVWLPTLIGYVQNQIMARAEQLARRSVAHDIRYVSEHVYLSLQGELAVLRDPARNQELLERLEKARPAPTTSRSAAPAGRPP